MQIFPVALVWLALLTFPSGPVTAADVPGAPATMRLTRVEPQYVCMMNNKLFDRAQIPVQVNKRTYYGCCEMCKEKLANDAQVRTAIDPVTKKTVDKATAVIAARPDGAVFYFENEGNLRKFGAPSPR